jgi:hypothetical protein
MLAAGCGSTRTSGTSANPASLVPASASLYLGATVKPDGALKTDALAAGKTLTHQDDPYLHLLAALRTPGSPPLDFDRDVAPWLGSQAGIFLSSADSSSQLLSLLQHGLLGNSSASAWPFGAQGGAQGAIVLDTRDVTEARSFIAAQARRAGAHTASYRGVAYYLAPATGVALGLVDRFAALGSEAGLHDVIDASLGGPSLARAAGYTKLLAAAPSGALGHLYTQPAGSTSGSSTASSTTGSSGTSATTAAGGAPNLSSLLGLLAGRRETNLALIPTANSLALNADALSATGLGGLLSAGSAGARTLGELPDESWLAVGLGDVGTALGPDVQSLGALLSLGGSAGAGGPPESTGSSGFTVKGVLEGIVTPLNALSANSAEAKRVFQSWMGPAGLFASGTGVVNLRAAIVIDSRNPAGSRAAVAKLGALLSKGESSSTQEISIPGTDAAISARVSGLPVELDIADGRAADGQTKFVIGLGEASVQDALHPSSTLLGSSTLAAAAAMLGEGAKPTMTVDFPELLGLLEGVGLSEDPSISGLLPDLRTLTTLAGGSHTLGGGIERTRVVVGLQPTG